MNKIKLLTPIFALATTASVVVPLTSCTKAELTWNSKRDGNYLNFKPRGEYTEPVSGKYSYDEAWNKYFSNKCYYNMLTNDIVNSVLHLMAITEDANLSMSIKVNSVNKSKHLISYSKHVYGKTDTSTLDIDQTVTVKNLHYDTYVYPYGGEDVKLFCPEWMLHPGNALWNDKSWSIKFTGDVKFTVNAENRWDDLPESFPTPQNVVTYISIEPYYFYKANIVE